MLRAAAAWRFADQHRAAGLQRSGSDSHARRRTDARDPHCSTNAEIIFVNDGSSDGSAELLDQLAADRHDIRVVHFSRNFGHQAAVHAGLAHASGDALVLMDSDMQDAPEAIERFLAKWQEGYDVVYAIQYAARRWLKRCIFTAFHRLLAAVATTRIPADAGNFGLITRASRQAHSGIDRARSLFAGFEVVGRVPTNGCGGRAERTLRCSPASFAVRSVAFGEDGDFLVFDLAAGDLLYDRLRGAGTFLALTVACVYVRVFTDLAIPGWTSHILSASFFGALNALGISMLGEYVVRIYDQVHGRPLYLVDRVVEHKSRPLAPPTVEDVDQWDDTYRELLEESSALLDMVAAAGRLSIFPRTKTRPNC